jgi:hypothetical protein
VKGTWDMGFRFSRLGTDTLLHEAAVGAPFQGANLAKQGIAQRAIRTCLTALVFLDMAAYR